MDFRRVFLEDLTDFIYVLTELVYRHAICYFLCKFYYSLFNMKFGRSFISSISFWLATSSILSRIVLIILVIYKSYFFA